MEQADLALCLSQTYLSQYLGILRYLLEQCYLGIPV